MQLLNVSFSLAAVQFNVAEVMEWAGYTNTVLMYVLVLQGVVQLWPKARRFARFIRRLRKFIRAVDKGEDEFNAWKRQTILETHKTQRSDNDDDDEQDSDDAQELGELSKGWLQSTSTDQGCGGGISSSVGGATDDEMLLLPQDGDDGDARSEDSTVTLPTLTSRAPGGEGVSRPRCSSMYPSAAPQTIFDVCQKQRYDEPSKGALPARPSGFNAVSLSNEDLLQDATSILRDLRMLAEAESVAVVLDPEISTAMERLEVSQILRRSRPDVASDPVIAELVRRIGVMDAASAAVAATSRRRRCQGYVEEEEGGTGEDVDIVHRFANASRTELFRILLADTDAMTLLSATQVAELRSAAQVPECQRLPASPALFAALCEVRHPAATALIQRFVC